MPIEFVTGDIFESSMQTLVNPVNCFGIMGRGVALKFKKKYPEMFKDYVIKCNTGILQVGNPDIYKETTPWIVNFPTKNHWRDPSRLKFIESGLDYLMNHYKEWGIESLATPALGCGLGGLDWASVKIVMGDYLGKLDIPIEIYEPVIGFKLRPRQ